MALLTQASHARIVAVAVGINKYDRPSISELNAAANDAKGLAEALQSVGVAGDDIRLMTSEEKLGSPCRATRWDIPLALDWASRRIGADDTFIFYFAGHGISRWGKSHLLPVDARTETPTMAADSAPLFDPSCLSAIISKRLGLGWVRRTEWVTVAGPRADYAWTLTGKPSTVRIIREIDEDTMKQDIFRTMKGQATKFVGLPGSPAEGANTDEADHSGTVPGAGSLAPDHGRHHGLAGGLFPAQRRLRARDR